MVNVFIFGDYLKLEMERSFVRFQIEMLFYQSKVTPRQCVMSLAQREKSNNLIFFVLCFDVTDNVVSKLFALVLNVRAQAKVISAK